MVRGVVSASMLPRDNKHDGKTMGRNVALPAPMKARDVRKQVDLDSDDPYRGIKHLLTPRYAIERKYDGCRGTVELRDTGNLVWSKRRDVSMNLPALRNAVVRGANYVLLDGELLANGPNGQVGSAATSLLTALPKTAHEQQAAFGDAWFAVFDILHLGDLQPIFEEAEMITHGQSVMTLPYKTRRQMLVEIMPFLGPSFRLVPSEPATVEVLESHREHEGVVFKGVESRYAAGSKSGDWHKLKWTSTADAFITGFTPGEGSNSGLVGSLTLSVYDGDNVVDVAKVGVFPQSFRRKLSAPDGSLKREYYTKVVEFTGQCYRPGGSVRHPRFGELRPDKGPDDCDLKNILDVFPYG